MLLSLMIFFAVGAILLFGMEAFDDLWNLWTHPDHKGDKDDVDHHKPKLR